MHRQLYEVLMYGADRERAQTSYLLCVSAAIEIGGGMDGVGLL